MLVGYTVFNGVFGVWMEDSYGLKITALGLAAWLSDRVGNESAVSFSLAANLLVAVNLRWLAFSLWGALLCLALFYISYEFAAVSNLPLMSEILLEQRATSHGGLHRGSFAGCGHRSLAGPVVLHSRHLV